jgi:uncharacterized protein (DUF1778 family)
MGKLKRIDLYVERNTERVLKEAAAEDGRTVSNYIARVLDEYVETFLLKRKDK